MPSRESEIQLLRKVVSRDRDSFERLYDLYASRVYGLALRILRRREEAEEIAQDVFHEIWRSAASYDPGRGTPAAWILTLARSRAIDRLRQLRRREEKAMSLDALLELGELKEAGRESGGPLDARLSVEGPLGSLAPEERRVLELAYFEGMTQSEMAAFLEWPIGTVKTRVRAALAALRGKWLKKEKDLLHES